MNETAVSQTPQETGVYPARTFTNVTIYRMGFGVVRTDCRTLSIRTGVKYAQYTNAVRVEYLEKGKRTPRAFILDYEPWLRVVPTAEAIDPDKSLVPNGDGSAVSRYSSCDPRWETDFEDKLKAAGSKIVWEIGEGKRDGGADADA